MILRKTPRNSKNYCYALCVLDNVQCENDTIKLSDVTKLKKARDIKNKYGKQFLGEEAIKESKKLQRKKWNYEDKKTSFNVYPPFDKNLSHMFSLQSSRHYRRYIYSDCVLEHSFPSASSIGSNEKMRMTQEESRLAVTAMRILDYAKIRAYGPAEYRTHPSIQGGGLSMGNLDDEVLSGKIDNKQILKISRAKAKL